MWPRVLTAILTTLTIVALRPAQEKPDSVRLGQLQAQVEARNGTAIERFWKEITQHGTPLCEILPDDAARMLVTFLWKDPGDTKDVVIVARLNGVTPFQDRRSHMERLAGTDVWYRSYRVPKHAHFLYQFSINLQEAVAAQDTGRLRATLQPDPLNPNRYLEAIEGPAERPRWHYGSIVTLPEAPRNLWIEKQEGVPGGMWNCTGSKALY